MNPDPTQTANDQNHPKIVEIPNLLEYFFGNSEKITMPAVTERPEFLFFAIPDYMG